MQKLEKILEEPEINAIKQLKEDNEGCYRACEGACNNIKEGKCRCGDGLIILAIEKMKNKINDDLVEYDADLDAPFGDIDNITGWQPSPEPYRPERNKTMTENKAISELEKFQLQVEHSIAEEECCEYENPEEDLQKDKKFIDAFKIAIKALKEIQQYREVGTVEECREAMEKLKRAEEALNVILSGNYNDECNFCVHHDNPMANCQCISGDGSWCFHNAKWNGRVSDNDNLEGMEE